MQSFSRALFFLLLLAGWARGASTLVESVGSTSAVQTATVTVSTAGQVTQIAVVTQGTTGLDFNPAPGGTCAAGATYSAGDTCTVQYTFTPQRPGVRYGAAVLRDSQGNALGTAYLQATGTGPMLNFSPAATILLPFDAPPGVQALAVDSAGNLFIADAGLGNVPSAVLKETKSGSGWVQTAVGNYSYYSGPLAVDGAGNIFIAFLDYELIEMSPVGNGYQQTAGFAGLGTITAVAVDGSGNLYVGGDAVGLIKETLAGGVYSASTINSKLHAKSIAVDGNGTVYATEGESEIYAETPSNGGYTQTTALSGFLFPKSLSVDGVGNLYIGDYSSGIVYKETLLPGGGFVQSTPVVGVHDLAAVAADANGNVYYAPLEMVVTPSIYELDNFDPPTLQFATTAPRQTSSDSPKTVTFYNAGNATFGFDPSSGKALNPAISPGFTVSPASTCSPNPGQPDVGEFLGPQTSCTYAVSFDPLYGGPWAGTMVVADNNLNTLSPTQSIPLIGNSNGTAPPAVTSVIPNSGPASGNTAVAITGVNLAGASAVSFGGTPAASFTVNSATSITAVSPTGTATVDVTVTTPDGTSIFNPNDRYTYTSTTQTIDFNPPASAYAGTSVRLQATGGASGNPVVFSVVSGPAMVSGANGSTLTFTAPGTVVIEADQAAGGGYTAAPPVQATLSPAVLTAPVGTVSGPISTLVTFQQAGTLSSIRSFSRGAAGQDFSMPTGGTCGAAASYAAGDTCVQPFVFSPTHPGERLGGAVFNAASGSVLATAYVYGVGTGPQVTFPPGKQIQIPGNLVQPAGIAVSGTGDIFVATYGSGLYEIPAGGQPRQIGSFTNCQDVAVDGVGNLFVIDDKSTLSEVVAVNGTIPDAPAIVAISSQFSGDTSVKVDGLGNVYVSTVGFPGPIYKVVAVDGAIPASPAIEVVSSNFNGATGIAVDSSGNLFVSDDVQNGVFELMAVNGGIPASPTIRTLATGLNLPSNITLDAAGDIFVSEYGDADVKELLAVDGSVPDNPTILSLGSGLASPQGLFVDQSGNVFVADSGLTYAVELDLADPPTLSFASTYLGQTSSDSPRTVTFFNDGNAPLVFAPPASGLDPTVTQGFTIGASSTCPQLSPGSAAAQLAPGSSCNDLVSFAPVVPGNPVSGQLATVDDALNLAGATQTVVLNGDAPNPIVPTITFSVANQVFGTPPFPVAAVSNSPGAIAYSVVSGPATISGSMVTLTGAGTVELLATQAQTGQYAPGTATATFSVAKQPQTISFAPLTSPASVGTPPVTLVASATSGLPVSFSVVSGTARLSGNLLTFTAAGTVVVAANQPGNAQYAAASAATQTVLVLPRVTVALTATPNPVFLDNPLTLTATLSTLGAAPAGTVTFLDGTQPIGTAAVAGGTATLALSTLGVGTHSIAASYGGSASYASAVSPPVSVMVEDFSLTMAAPNVTIFHGGTARFLLNLSATDGAGMASPVNIAVSGEPEGSKVSIAPAAVAMGSGATAVTVAIQTPDYPSGSVQASATRGGARRGVDGGAAFAGLLLAAWVLLPRGSGRRIRLKRVRAGLLAALALAGLANLGGCGRGWKTQSWTIHVTATSGALSHTATATLTSECKDGHSACQI